MENKIAYNKLVNFIINEFWGEKEKMTPKTTIESDLGITGTDGIVFLEKFVSYFNISYDEKKEWQFYFDSEGAGFIDFVAIFNWILGKNKDKKKYDLTLEHLAKIIEIGYWVDME
ncbi:MAG: hypothetical protein ACK5MG_03675 [Bacteroidales bacterium]